MQGIFKNEWMGCNYVIVFIATCFELKFLMQSVRYVVYINRERFHK